MKHITTDENKTRWIGISKPKEKMAKNNILYVSPDNLGMLMDALLVEKYRPLVLAGADSKYKNTLQEAIKLYDSGELYDFKIALVRNKEILSMEKPNTIDMRVKDYVTGNNTIKIGEHTLDGLKTYFNKKNLEQKIYSDCHLIE